MGPDVYSSMFMRALASIIALGLAPGAGGGEFQEVATCKPAVDWGFPELHALRAAGGKIYMGYGDWDAHPGPVILTSYDPRTAIVTAEATFHSDSIGELREIDGAIYLPSMDPVHYQHFEDYLVVHPDGRLESRTPGGFLHVFDIFKSTSGDLWAMGSMNSNEWPYRGGSIFRSSDQGATWSNATPWPGVPSRYYWGRQGTDGIVFYGKTFVDPEWIPNSQSQYVAAELRQVEDAAGLWTFFLADKLPGFGGKLGFLIRRSPDGEPSNLVSGYTSSYALRGKELFLLDDDRRTVYRLPDATLAAPVPQVVTTLPENCSSLALLDNVLYAGSRSGKLYAYALDGGVLPAPAREFRTTFPERAGEAISIDGDTMAVGVPRFSGTDGSELKLQSGKVEIFTRPSANEAWMSDTTLERAWAAVLKSGDWFGSSLALKADTLVVGVGGRMVLGDRGQESLVIGYRRSGGDWTQSLARSLSHLHSLRMTADGLMAASEESVYRYADRELGTYRIYRSTSPYSPYGVLAAAPGNPNVIVRGLTGDLSRGGGSGVVHVFDAASENHTPVQMLSSEAGGQDRFGFSVAVRGSLLAVGAPRSDMAGLQAGAVCLYGFEDGQWQYRSTLTAPDAMPEDGFGHAAALTEDETLWIGAPSADGARGERGAVYAYTRTEDAWTLERKFTPGRLETRTWRFGETIEADGMEVVVASGQTDDSLPVLQRLRFLSLKRSPFQEWAAEEGIPAQRPDPLQPYPERSVTLLEAFALNSHVNGGPAVGRTPDAIIFQFRRRKDPASFGLDYRVEVSPDLAAWFPFEAPEDVIEDDETWETVRLTISGGGQAEQFIRVRIILQT